jgi:hypothetical protein
VDGSWLATRLRVGCVGLAAITKPAARDSPEGKAAVAAEAEFTIGTRASCSDGSCGEVRRLIIDAAAGTVTHLVIQPGHQPEDARLVPIDLVETAAGEIRLRCTLAQFGQLELAEEFDLVDDAMPGSGAFVGAGGERIGLDPLQKHPRTLVNDVVPEGETQVRPGDPVHAVDGEIGRVQGFVVDPGDGRVTHVLLQEGHLWGRKQVAIPISAVTGLDPEIRLNLTKEQVGDLPPAQ